MVALILLILNFVLIQASYGSLVRPNLSSNSTLTCDSLMRITGQGAVYVTGQGAVQGAGQGAVYVTLQKLSEDSDSGDETGVPEISFLAQQKQVVGKTLLLLNLYRFRLA